MIQMMVDFTLKIWLLENTKTKSLKWWRKPLGKNSLSISFKKKEENICLEKKIFRKKELSYLSLAYLLNENY